VSPFACPWGTLGPNDEPPTYRPDHCRVCSAGDCAMPGFGASTFRPESWVDLAAERHYSP
jgi:hypothetical protein